MRIWLLTSEVPQEVAGGIARYIDTMARLLGTAGHEVVIIARTEHTCDQEIAPRVRLIGVVSDYARLNEPNPGEAPRTHPAYPYNFLSYWPAFSYQMAEVVLQLTARLPLPDIIESQEYGAVPYYLLQRKLTERTALEHIPILVHLHSPVFELEAVNQHARYRFPEYWIGQMEKFSILAADAVLSPSDYLAQRVQQALEHPVTIARIPYPLAVTPEESLPAVQRGKIVYVGRLELRKGVFPLVKACSRLWAAGEDFQLVMIGGDTDFVPRATTCSAFLRQRYAKWIDSGQLQLVGQLGREGVLAHLQQAWAVVVPSIWENFPNTCMEAMGVGQVVLASQTGGQAEMIKTDGDAGFLFDWGKAGEFEKQLRKILVLSETERSVIARRAQERIATLCAPEDICRQRVQHYEAVIARRSSRAHFPTVNRIERKLDAPTPRQNVETAAQPALLSVVIPFYNLGTYVRETLENVRAASYSPLEILLVNDGSSEPQSLEALNEIEKQNFPNVRILHTENQGLAATRNCGAEAAQGEFLTFVDADDLVEPDFFACAIDILRRYANVTFVYSWVQYMGESNGIWPTWNTEFPYLLGHNMLTAFVVIRREAFVRWARNQPLFEYGLEDYDGWVSLVESGGVGVSIPQPLVRYRIRGQSMYRSSNRNQQLYLFDLLTQRHAESYRRWGAELFNLQNANGPGYLWNNPAIVAEMPAVSIVALEQQRDRLVTEVQTLGKAWEDHVRFIAAQRAYIEDLEARCRELMPRVYSNGASALAATNGIPLEDYELGGRLVSRVRQTWLARAVLRSPRMKKVLRSAFRR